MIATLAFFVNLKQFPVSPSGCFGCNHSDNFNNAQVPQSHSAELYEQKCQEVYQHIYENYSG
ncbi:hypothetical protein GJB62_06595 [Nostoc sp. ATCC 53789]|nr:hypothetical protein GJB62_06595 [Nostoc sp. ATCC 53789]